VRASEAFWRHPDTVGALQRRDIGRLFRLFGVHANASQTRMGEAVGLSQGQVSQVMNGTRRITNLDVLERIAQGLAMPDHARIQLGLAPTLDGPAPAAPRTAPAGTADAREDASATASVTGPDVPAPAGDLVGIAQLRKRVQHITAAYDTVPSVSLLAAAGQVQAQIAGLREWVSYVALYGVRRPAIGLSLAAQAAQRSTGYSPTLTGVSLLHVAEAHGFLGDRLGCEQALEDAQAQLSQRDELDAAADFFSPAQFGRMAGSCYLSLGLPAKAQAHLTQTAEALRGRQKVSAILLGNLTLAYLRQRKLEESTATLHAAIDEVERTRGGGGLNLVFAAGRELRPWRQEQAVQDVHDRLMSLMA
jgi:transcriptional regulator with XRE-family HTH domain